MKQLTFASRLRQLRESAGLSQRALAASAEISQQALQKLESNQVGEVRASTALRLARALGVSVEQLLEG